MGRMNADEILELIWMQRERKQKVTIESLSKEGNERLDEPLHEMERAGLIAIADGTIRLTDKGERNAAELIRCHRLAERLLTDVLSLKDEFLEAQACEFEHILSPEVTESICTLLGHPRMCPHGMPIPPGECCKRGLKDAEPIVVSLDKLPPGVTGRVRYVETPDHARLDKLASFGLVPGAIVTMHQRQPSLVVRIGETQLAMDELIARSVHVQRMPQKNDDIIKLSSPANWLKRHRHGRRRTGPPDERGRRRGPRDY